MKNVPEKIYLQIGEETESTDDFNELCKYGEITWWKRRIFKSDIEYQHTDELDRLRAQNAEFVFLLRQADKLDRDGYTLTSSWFHEVRNAIAKYEESLASQDAGQH